jgi:hypothetical protein
MSPVLLAASTAVAQTGLPQYGVVLGGTVNSPVIINNSSHRILAYTLSFDMGNGVPPHNTLYMMIGQLRDRSPSLAGIAPGANFVHSPGTLVQVQDARGKSSTAGAIAVALDSVLFDDGTLVGPDKAGNLDSLLGRVDGEKDVHAIFAGANSTAAGAAILEGFASGQTVPPIPPGRSRNYQRQYLASVRANAIELLNVWKRGGDAAALKKAHSSDSYPAIVRGEQE